MNGVSNTVLPPQVTLFGGFCEINLSPVPPFHVCVPVVSQFSVAVNGCPGVTVAGTVCEINCESKAVPAAPTTIEKALCAVAEAESVTRTVKP